MEWAKPSFYTSKGSAKKAICKMDMSIFDLIWKPSRKADFHIVFQPFWSLLEEGDKFECIFKFWSGREF